MKPGLDLEKLGYVAAERREALGLTTRRLAEIAYCSPRQVSYLMNGKPVCAFATFMLCETLGIDFSEMLAPDAKARLMAIRDKHESEQKQVVTPHVQRETSLDTLPIGEGAH